MIYNTWLHTPALLRNPCAFTKFTNFWQLLPIARRHFYQNYAKFTELHLAILNWSYDVRWRPKAQKMKTST